MEKALEKRIKNILREKLAQKQVEGFYLDCPDQQGLAGELAIALMQGRYKVREYYGVIRLLEKSPALAIIAASCKSSGAQDVQWNSYDTKLLMHELA